MLEFREKVSLKPYNTFGVDVITQKFIAIDSIDTLKKAITLSRKTPFRILGGGSNVLFTKDFDGATFLINNKGIIISNEDENHVLVEVQAGENWHEFVVWCIKNNYGGVENLSLIPGSVGAAPIQNIGAYGVELKSIFYSCQALNVIDLSLKKFNAQECDFGYRTSVFKTDLKGKFIITSVCFQLKKVPHEIKISYGALKVHLKDKLPSIQNVAQAVIDIRQSKLPDPKKIGNGGSFFKNPLVSNSLLKRIQKLYPEIPNYPNSDNQVKIPAGWLIESLGFKGTRDGDAGVHKDQALVLVNYGSAKGSEIIALAKKIQSAVNQKFQIQLEIEVNIL